MKRYVAKVWYNPAAGKYFGLSDHTNDVHVQIEKEALIEELEATFTGYTITWEHDSLTNTTRGSIVT